MSSYAIKLICKDELSNWDCVLHLVLSLLLNGEGNGNPLQYSCLENHMGRGAWQTAVHGIPNSQTWLSDFTFTFHVHALEKEMATHSSVLAWRIPGTGEPGGLTSIGLHRVGHDWSSLAAAAAAAGGPVAKTPCFQFKGPGFDPGPGARFHKLQLKTSQVTAKMEDPASCS